ncbi:hypothetical protein BZA77DRAFT_356572 [Pyronema omphalodes]|nr:hypothetical protein BZA77DRAFT_356572 [Pyronema omphalodes]
MPIHAHPPRTPYPASGLSASSSFGSPGLRYGGEMPIVPVEAREMFARFLVGAEDAWELEQWMRIGRESWGKITWKTWKRWRRCRAGVVSGILFSMLDVGCSIFDV